MSRETAEQHNNRGNDQFRAREYLEARDSYSAAIAELVLPQYLTNRAMASLKLSHFREALEDCAEALSLAPSDSLTAKAHVRRGLAFKALGETASSLSEFQAAVEPSRHNAEVLRYVDSTRKLLLQETGARFAGLSAVQLVQQLRELRDQQEHQGEDGEDEGLAILAVLCRLREMGEQGELAKEALLSPAKGGAGGLDVLCSFVGLLVEEQVLAVVIELLVIGAKLDSSVARAMVAHPDLIPLLITLLQDVEAARPAVLTIFLHLSQSETLRGQMHTYSLLEQVWRLMQTSFDPRTLYFCASIFQRHALDEREGAFLLANIDTLVADLTAMAKEVDAELAEAAAGALLLLSTHSHLQEPMGTGPHLRELLAATRSQQMSATEPPSGDGEAPATLTHLLGVLMNLALCPASRTLLSNAAVLQQLLILCSVAHADSTTTLRAVAVISRCLSTEGFARVFLSAGGVGKFMSVATAAVKSRSVAVLKHLCQGLAVAAMGDGAVANEICQRNDVAVLVRCLRVSDEFVAGNAALCVAECARTPANLPVIRRHRPIPSLVDLMRDARGQLQRNAALALLQLSKDPAMKHDIADLGATEAMYQINMNQNTR